MSRRTVGRSVIAVLLAAVLVEMAWIVLHDHPQRDAEPDPATLRLAANSAEAGDVLAADIVVPPGASSDSRSAGLYQRRGDGWQFQYVVYLVDRPESLDEFRGYARRSRPAVGGTGIATGRTFLEVPPVAPGDYRLVISFSWPAHHPYWGNELLLHDDFEVVT